MIPYGRQNISEEDIEAVVEVLRSDFLTQGEVVPAFESRVASYVGASFCVATNSATSALHLACLALGVGPGDSVWTSAITFVASANCVRYCGATVRFIDIDPATYNLSVEWLAEQLDRAERLGCLPKVVIPVHLCGQPCDMAGISALAKRYGFRVIEDASHAIGARYKGETIGNCRYSDITVFSFHPVKIITTGEGGAALTNDAEIARRMHHLRSHGITRNVSEMLEVPHGPWYYEQNDLGFNYRLTDIQAALGLSQMNRLECFVAERRTIATKFDDLLSNFPVTRPWQHPDCVSAFHLYVIRLKSNIDRIHKKKIFESLRADGVGVNIHYMPVYMHPYYRRLYPSLPICPEAESYYIEAISLPIFPGLTEAQQHQIVTALRKAL